MVCAPLTEMCEIEYADVRQRQIECLINIVQSKGQQLRSHLWPTIINVVGSFVNGQFR